MTVLRNSLARCNARHLRIKRLVQFIFVGAVYHNALSNCAALLCRTQRRVAHMCSSTVSDTANRLRKTRKKKSSVVPPVSQRSHVGNLHQIRKQGKGRSSKRKENRRLSFLFAHRRGYGVVPAAGAATFPPSADGESPAEVQRKTPRPLGANTLTQFAHPAQPVLKKLPPGQGEPPARFRCPNRPVQKKGDARTGRSAYAPRVHQKAGAAKKSAAHGHLSTRENQIFLRFTL